jgi:8-oxo-dGTP pyrophosphatase MutT (NUDIX family)
MDVDLIRDRISRYKRHTVDGPELQRAAVAIILRNGAASAEFLAIHRSEREGDPWSGHMAFPGGRQHSSDSDLYATASRETLEEVGIDLRTAGEHIGSLDDLQAIGHGRRLDLVITPHVYSLTTTVTPILDPREVQTAVWVPVKTLHEPHIQGTYRYDLNGFETQHEAFIYEGYIIWGLTYRILRQFLELLN